jgi:thiol:disulfide interchange protein
MLETITSIPSVQAFAELLQKNPGLVILKFGAAWCGPCKRIEGLVNSWYQKMPNTVQTCLIDIDEDIELYTFLKAKRRINGVPGLFCYDKGNVSYIPSDFIMGADEKTIHEFFTRCGQRLMAASRNG